MTMVRKRSRSATEQRFQDAVLELLAEHGFARMGVNLVAERAGADKVLIYRYFGDLDGLLQRVARGRAWLPAADALCSALPGEPKQMLAELARRVTRHIRRDAPGHQLSLWRHAAHNPLTKQFTAEWQDLWRELPQRLGAGLDYEARQNWSKACALLALTIQAELADEAIDPRCLDALSASLLPPALEAEDEFFEEDADVLPTNLL